MAARKKRRCKYGVNKRTKLCLKSKRTSKRKASPKRKRRCKFGVNKSTKKCLKRRRARR